MPTKPNNAALTKLTKPNNASQTKQCQPNQIMLMNPNNANQNKQRNPNKTMVNKPNIANLTKQSQLNQASLTKLDKSTNPSITPKLYPGLIKKEEINKPDPAIRTKPSSVHHTESRYILEPNSIYSIQNPTQNLIELAKHNYSEPI